MSSTTPRALIITYYWPPAGGGGVQRWVKFAKYLREFGVEPVVYAPDNADYPLLDASLESEVKGIEVIKQPIWEARRLYQRFVGKKDSVKDKSSDSDNLFYKDKSTLSLKQKLALYIRSNFFIPDARYTWIKPSVKYLKSWLKENPVDIVITTGPPHSCHLIGLQLKNESGLPWIADFRDPWTDIEYFAHLSLSKRSRLKHEQLQRKVMTTADRVVTVSWSWAKLFEKYGAKDVVTITNGYDPDDFTSAPPQKRNDTFVIASVGTLELDRNPTELWSALEQFVSTNDTNRRDVLVQLVGKVDKEILNLVPEDLRSNVELTGYVSHERAVEMMREAHVLLLVQNRTVIENVKGRIPGKVFEYLAAKVPILLIGDKESDLANVVRESELNCVCDFGDIATIAQFLNTTVNNIDKAHAAIEMAKYERRTLTGSLVEVLNDVLAKRA